MFVHLDVHVQVSGRKFHVLLTSYELLMGAQDRPRLSRIHWGGIVVDEGHRCLGMGKRGVGPACRLLEPTVYGRGPPLSGMLQVSHIIHTLAAYVRPL
jgi:hypothetical protein